MTSAASRLSSFLPDPGHRPRSHRRRQPRKPDRESSTSSEEEGGGRNRPDVWELRRRRADYYTITPEDRRVKSQTAMAERMAPGRASSVRIPSTKKPEIIVREVREHHPAEHRHRRRRTKPDADRDAEPVYVYRSRPSDHSPPPLQRSKTARTTHAAPAKEVRRSSEGVVRSRTERRPSHHQEGEAIIRRVVSVNRHPEPVHRPRSRHNQVPITRSSSVRESASALPVSPSLHRSQTTARKVRPPPQAPPPPVAPREYPEPTPSVARGSQKSSGFLGSILGIPKVPPPPEKQVECLTCLSTYPASRTARLACSHRMCHSCLRRIFTLSITDPQHMPPKCCTADHIPLKHVDKLFDTKFKMKWNRKYQEYTTKNRLYCPARGCGEWIKPTHIHTDNSGGANTGRKYGKCGRCRTKVCVECNGRWHSGRVCPKDDATKQFIEIAKREGWQRCYNCSATVELKEGCNHMTCRCKAEFCMICGVKWKGCDCPWFNYQAVERDRLVHAQDFPVERRVEVDPDHARVARGYQAEIEARREQERRDEAFARRLQGLGMGPSPGAGVEIYQIHDDDDDDEDDNNRGAALPFLPFPFHRQPPPPPPAMGNIISSPPFMSQPPPPPPQPILRRHSQASRAYNRRLPSGRAAERIVPAREERGYEREREVFAPVGRGPGAGFGGPGEAGLGVIRGFSTEPRGSALAGLTRGGTAEGRVEEWRRWVEVG
ncbi:MAG: hypothetical protein Q9216_005990 [Gyalolechia sp. 2 TL-2023]